MIDKGVIVTLLLAVCTGVVKAHAGGIKLLLLAGAGIAGLYMLHLLAQDYTKYQASRPKLLGSLFKRSIDESQYADSGAAVVRINFIIRRQCLEDENSGTFPPALSISYCWNFR